MEFGILPYPFRKVHLDFEKNRGMRLKFWAKLNQIINFFQICGKIVDFGSALTVLNKKTSFFFS